MALGTPSLLHGLHPAKHKPTNDAEDETDLDLTNTTEGGPAEPGAEGEGAPSGEQDSVTGSSTRTTDNQTILRLLEEGEKVGQNKDL